MGKQKVIRAMKDGMEGTFSEMSWDIGNPEKEGWVRLGESDAIEAIAAEEVGAASKKIEVIDIEKDGDTKDDSALEGEKDYPTDEEIKAFLTKEGIKFHKMLGTVKLRKKYDENTK